MPQVTNTYDFPLKSKISNKSYFSTFPHLFGALLSFPLFLSVDFLSICYAIIERAAFYWIIWVFHLKDSHQTGEKKKINHEDILSNTTPV